MTLAEQIVAKQRRLVREKAVSEVEKMRSEGALLELRTDLETFKREEAALARDIGEQQSTLANLPARQQTEISQLERAAATYKQEILDYSLRGEQTIRAAASGRVNALNAEAGQQVDPARLLLSIVPQDAELVVQLYVPSRAIGFIAPEDRVILRYQAYPYQKFGHAEGRILSIVKKLKNRNGVASPCRTTCTVCGDAPCYAFLSIQLYCRDGAGQAGIERAGRGIQQSRAAERACLSGARQAG